MTMQETTSSWLERVEEIIHVLEGSSVSEIELTENGTEIIIRRKPGFVTMAVNHAITGVASNGAGHTATTATKSDSSIGVVAPLTGVYYAAASPSTPPFVSVGDVVHVGQVVALVEAMKVFNEVTAEVSGRVTAMVATNGSVVQKGDVLIRIEPA